MAKKIISLVMAAVVITLSVFGMQCMEKNRSEDKLLAIVTENKKPIEPLLQLLAETNIQHDGTLANIVQETQKTQPEGWLRDPNKERWEIDQYSLQKDSSLLPLFSQLGMIEEISPSQKQYDYVLLLGATLTRVRSRLAYLVNLWNQGVRFKKIILLGGQRPLDVELESKEQLLNANNGIVTFKDGWQLEDALPQVEGEMIKFVLDQSKLPDAWSDLEIIQINPPMKEVNGELKRPTTQDTIVAWIDTKPTPGSILAISNQPFVGYQDAVIRSVVPKGFSLETVGKKIGSSPNIAVLLDTCARWLYTENSK